MSRFVEGDLEVCVNIPSVVIDDGRLRQKIPRLVNETPTVVSPGVVMLTGNPKPIKVMHGCKGFIFMDSFRFLSFEGLTL